MSKCVKCSKKIKESYDCDSCKRCFCMDCSELTSDEIRCMTLRKRKLIFLCNDCEHGLRKIPSLTKEIEELKVDLQEIKKLSSNINNFSNMELMMEEIQERQKRSCNLIVTNIRESAEGNKINRLNDDTNTVKGILCETGIDNNFHCRVQRLGKFDPQKNRPVKVMLSNREEVLYLLKNRKKISAVNVKIFADQTIMQRDYYKSLKQKIINDDTKIIKYINNIPKIVDKAKFDSRPKNH